jgi:hypothetical protein
MLPDVLFLCFNTKNLYTICTLFYHAPKYLSLPFLSNNVHTRQDQEYAGPQTRISHNKYKKSSNSHLAVQSYLLCLDLN